MKSHLTDILSNRIPGFIVTGFIYLFFLFSFSESHAADSANFSKYFIEAAASSKKAVVNIIVYTRSGKERESLSKEGFGSGTIISGKGYVVTNYHVLKKGNFFQVFLHNGKECEIQPVYKGDYYVADKKTDIAIFKLDESDISGIEPVPIEDSANLSEGEWVLAIGNPYGLRQSITCGIVSSIGRNDIGFADIEDFIQTDVPINPGNSGGPLVNLNGRLVGINTAIRTASGGYQGISFAIPSNIVKQVYIELIKYGRVRRGWLGFLARESKISDNVPGGAIEVISVIENSPAELSGIRKGDLIKDIDGESINTLGELIKSVSNKPVGSTMQITASRDGKLYKHKLILIEKQFHQKIRKGLEMIYSLYGIELDRNSIEGNVVISYLSPMGLAYQSGFKKGDTVKSINGKSVLSLEELTKVFFNTNSRIIRMEVIRDSRIYGIDVINDYN